MTIIPLVALRVLPLRSKVMALSVSIKISLVYVMSASNLMVSPSAALARAVPSSAALLTEWVVAALVVSGVIESKPNTMVNASRVDNIFLGFFINLRLLIIIMLSLAVPDHSRVFRK